MPKEYHWERLVELIILMAAILAPQFLLAAEVDGDEFAKATVGVVLAGVVVGGYKIWMSTLKKSKKPDKGDSN